MALGSFLFQFCAFSGILEEGNPQTLYAASRDSHKTH